MCDVLVALGDDDARAQRRERARSARPVQEPARVTTRAVFAKSLTARSASPRRGPRSAAWRFCAAMRASPRCN
jgi:hypothetical protein